MVVCRSMGCNGLGSSDSYAHARGHLLQNLDFPAIGRENEWNMGQDDTYTKGAD